MFFIALANYENFSGHRDTDSYSNTDSIADDFDLSNFGY